MAAKLYEETSLKLEGVPLGPRFGTQKFERSSSSCRQKPISEISFVPGWVVHVLQNSADNPLQLFSGSLFFFQAPFHPLVVLEK